MKKTLNVRQVLDNLEKYIDGNKTVLNRDVYKELNIFDWFKNTLSISDMKNMRTFLKEALWYGFEGYCCFKVGAKGSANGMWAFMDESTDGFSPKNSPTLYRSFSPSYTYWRIDVTGNNEWLPKGNEFNTLKNKADLRSYVCAHGLNCWHRNWLVKWLDNYSDREKRITENTIEFVLPKNSYEEEFGSSWHIVYALKKRGYDFEINKGDWEYTTSPVVEARSLNVYKGHKAYLRDRYIIKAYV